MWCRPHKFHFVQLHKLPLKSRVKLDFKRDLISNCSKFRNGSNMVVPCKIDGCLQVQYLLQWLPPIEMFKFISLDQVYWQDCQTSKPGWSTVESCWLSHIKCAGPAVQGAMGTVPASKEELGTCKKKSFDVTVCRLSSHQWCLGVWESIVDIDKSMMDKRLVFHFMYTVSYHYEWKRISRWWETQVFFQKIKKTYV